MSAPTYTVFTTDVLTGRRLCESLPISIEQFAWSINGPGTFSGTGSFAARPDLLDYLECRKNALWVDRDGRLVWGGILYEIDNDVTARTAKIGASGFLSHLDRCPIETTLTYAGTEQLTIATSLIDYAQSGLNQDVGLTYSVPSPPSGVTRDRTYNWFDDKMVLPALTDLAQVEQGFEFVEDYAYGPDGVTPVPLVVFGYPTVGRAATRLLWTYDDSYPEGSAGNIVTYSWPFNGSASANRVIEEGAGEGDAMITYTLADTEEITAGYPRHTAIVSRKDITEIDTLVEHAVVDLVGVLGDRVVPTFTVRANNAPELGEWMLGDVARFRLTSCVHRSPDGITPGYDGALRIVAATVNPQASSATGAGQEEQVVLTMNGM